MRSTIDFDDLESISTDEIISFTMLLESVFVGLGLIIFFLVFIIK